MDGGAGLKTKVGVGLFYLVLLGVAAGWMWVGTLLVGEFGTEALVRAGWAGEAGTVVVSQCETEGIDMETEFGATNCVGWFMPADGVSGERKVAVPNTSEDLGMGSRFEARALDQLAYQPSGYHLGVSIAGALLFGVLGGIPVAIVAMNLFLLLTPEGIQVEPGLGATALALISIAGEFGLTWLLS